MRTAAAANPPVGDVELQRGFDGGGRAGWWGGWHTAIGSKPPHI
jgi:hypothetical protein